MPCSRCRLVLWRKVLPDGAEWATSASIRALHPQALPDPAGGLQQEGRRRTGTPQPLLRLSPGWFFGDEELVSHGRPYFSI